MSAKLLIVALICAVAYAQAGVITQTRYATRDCSGAVVSTGNTTTGVCTNVGSSLSTAYYMDSSNVYVTTFKGNGCNGTVQSVAQIPTGCGTSEFGVSLSVSGAPDTLPFGTFPPSGFLVSSTFRNTSAADAKATACSTGSGVVETKTASSTACTTRPDSRFTSQPSSTQGFCNADGTQSGYAVYSDLTCGTVVAGGSSSIGSCIIEGGIATQGSCGSTATFPESIPVTGYMSYSNADCSSANPTTAFIGATCFDSQTLVCAPVNGTDGYATYTLSNPAADAKDGTCGGTVIMSHQVLAGTCVKTGTTSRKYFCTSDGPGASASTASVSMVALLIAAVAAVFSVRSL